MTPWIKRAAMLLAVTSLTSGCIMYRLEELRNTTPQGTPFQNELSRMYMDFATQEEKAYDWQDSWYFADKGLRLAYGNEAGPEELSGWNIRDEASLMELEKLRIRVMDTLTPQLKERSPSKAAAVQFYFDCLVEQTEEGWQEEDIAYCRENLVHALSAGNIYDNAPVKSSAEKFMPKPKPKPAPAPKPEKTENVMPEKPVEAAAPKAKPEAKKEIVAETASYAVFFEAGSPDVAAPGKNVMNEVVASLKGKSDYMVVLHVAPISSAAMEKDLPSERIAVVKKMLVEGGVSESAIVGADTPEAAKPVSRRVELFLNE